VKARTQTPPRRDSSYDRCFGGLLAWVELDRSRVGLLEWIEDAEQEHRSIVKGPNQQPESRAEFAQRIVTEYEGFHPDHVAEREDVSARHVRDIRNEAGRSPLTGVPKVAL
jgi:hypothetical protein